MPFECHLKLGSIKGESSSAKHKDEIELLSYGFGITNKVIPGSDRRGGQASVSEMHCTKRPDKASSQIAYASLSHERFGSAIISSSKQTGGKPPEDYLTITLTNVYVTSYQISQGHREDVGEESFTLDFGKIDWDYKLQGADGILTTAGNMSYDLGKGSR